MKKKILVFTLCIAVFLSFCSFTNTSNFDATKGDDNLINISLCQPKDAYLPQYKITVNGQIIDNQKNEFPFLVCNNTTYMPMTYILNRFMGIRLYIYRTTPSNIERVYVGRAEIENKKFSYSKTSEVNSKKVSVSHLSMPLQLNNIGYNNNDKKMGINPAPFVFRNIIYLPLTREIMTEELGWGFSWSKKAGLKINTKDASRPIIFNPSEIENMGPWKYMENNPYDYACERNNYVGIKNKESKVELNDMVIIKEKGKPARKIKLENFGAIWMNNGVKDVKDELAGKGIVYPQLNDLKFTFVAVKTKNTDTKEIKKENLYLVTVDISNDRLTSKKMF
ncbi:hypothetical protein [Aminipila sp.]|uniref:hypothetical protein n=1 Tax=Aminipila sp. TaxID=2060095 RepID=UPI00289DE806|nr:hypothetical protein [Aminipila sp.]